MNKNYLKFCSRLVIWLIKIVSDFHSWIARDLYTYEMGKLLVSFIIQMPDCQGFLHQIDSAIESLGGKVFPKLNWSAPQVITTEIMAC